MPFIADCPVMADLAPAAPLPAVPAWVVGLPQEVLWLEGAGQEVPQRADSEQSTPAPAGDGRAEAPLVATEAESSISEPAQAPGPPQSGARGPHVGS